MENKSQEQSKVGHHRWREKKKQSPVPTPAGHQGSLFAVNMAACGGASNERSASADVKTQKREITELMEKKLVKGDTW